jgi:hypothetical protein
MAKGGQWPGMGTPGCDLLHLVNRRQPGSAARVVAVGSGVPAFSLPFPWG